MRYFLAIVYAFMNLAGCTDAQNRSIVATSEENGVVVLDSRTDVRMGRAWFHCEASRSGRCYYTVSGEQGSVAAFSLAVAETRRIGDLPGGFTQCVTTRAEDSVPSCGPH